MADALRVNNIHFGNVASNHNQAHIGFTSVGIGSTANYGALQFVGVPNTLCWTANGTVGIGTTNPSFTLDVVGNIRATGSITSASTNIIPTGIIVMWSGSVSNVPIGWVLCNGTNGAPNLMDRFIVGAGSTYTTGGAGNGVGGSNTVTLTVGNLPSHTHTVPDHTHTVPNHTHTIYDPGHSHVHNMPSSWATQGAGPVTFFSGGNTSNAGVSNTTNSATTGITGTNSGGGGTSGGSGTLTSGGAGTGAAITIIPLYYALCYIMKS